MIEIYTDVACNQKTNVGGWAYCIHRDGELFYEDSGRVENTTNNKMEMTAAICALRYMRGCPARSDIISTNTDSSYMVNGINEGWVYKWRENGWISSKKSPVLNQNFWNELQDLVVELNVEMKRILRSHPGIKYADKKAKVHTKC